MNIGGLPDIRQLYRRRLILSGISLATVVSFSFSDALYKSAHAQEPAGFSLSEITQSVVVDDDVYLNVVVNGKLLQTMYAFRQKDNGDFVIRDSDLKEIGLASARQAKIKGGWIDLAALPNVIHSYDTQQEAIEFVTSSESALLPYTVSADPWLDRVRRGSDDAEGKPRSDLAAVINYSLYASSGAEDVKDIFDFKGISGNIEGRVASRFGTVNSAQLLTYASDADNVYKSVRLESYWSYADQEKLLNYQAGDLITRSLPWSRSVRLGGFQLRRNFNLRPDLVTMPLPNFSGSASVPSAVDLYINNAKRASENVPAGPFSLTDMPVVSGRNTARLVVRDAQGRESVTEMSFFGSSDMLAKGYLDFSVEAGLPRQYYGSRSNDYDKKFFASGTARYGLTNNITLEGHTEVGHSFVNGGMGASFTLWDFGVMSLAASASNYKARTGQQFAAGLQMQKWGLSFAAHTQRAYNDYNDMASVVSERMQKKNWSADDIYANRHYFRTTTKPPKAINQVSLGIPSFFKLSNLNLSYTEVDNWDIEDSRYLGLSMSKSFDNKAFGYINAFQDLKKNNSYSVFVGLTISLDDKHTMSYDVNNDHYGTNFTSRLRRQMGGGIGDYGWMLHDIEGTSNRRGAGGSYRTPFGIASGSIEQYEHNYRATADMNGALVIADYSLIPSNSVYDSFAVVNVGAPGVDVYHQNSYYGKTGRSGKIVVPRLTSYRKNRLSIDMDTLPLDTLVTESDVVVTPAYQSGVVENFGVTAKTDYVFISLQDEKGRFIETGSYAEVAGTGKGVDIAYDGMAVLPTKGLKYPAMLMVERPDNRYCRAVLESLNERGVTAGAVILTCVPTAKETAAR